MVETNNNNGKNHQHSFLLGLSIGISIISTLAFFSLLIYMFTRGAKVATDNETNTAASTEYEQCLESTEFDSRIATDQQSGSENGVSGTPAVFVNGYLIAGAYPVEYFQQVIDDLLAGKTPTQEFLQDDSKKITKVEIALNSNDHVVGADNAPITLVEYSDFECPYCGRVVPTIDQLMQTYSGKIKLVFRHFPLSFHQSAKKAAVAAECANKQGKFWEMYKKLFDLNTAGTVNAETIKKAGKDIGLK